MIDDISYIQTFDEALNVLAEMKTFIEKNLDKRAVEEKWGQRWKEYRNGSAKFQDALPELPWWAQKQYSHIIALGGYIKASREAIRRLNAEIDESFRRGIARGKEIGAGEKSGSKYTTFYDKEGYRFDSITKARSTWPELF